MVSLTTTLLVIAGVLVFLWIFGYRLVLTIQIAYYYWEARRIKHKTGKLNQEIKRMEEEIEKNERETEFLKKECLVLERENKNLKTQRAKMEAGRD